MLDKEIEKIRSTRMRRKPYPHLVIDDFFEPEMFEKIQNYFPPKEKMVKSKEYSRQLDLVRDPGVASSDFLWSYKIHLEEAPLTFWNRFVSHFFKGEVPEAFREKFEIAEEVWFACGRLQIEGKGAGLGPHRDRFDKLVSCVIYLDDQPMAAGTDLYKAKNIEEVMGEQHYSHEKFDYVKTVEFKANRLIAWPVVPESFHGYHQEEEVERRTIKYFIHKKEDEAELQARIAATKERADDWKKNE